MATELKTRCPICLDNWEEASYVLPCLHQFCYPCIVRWAESKPECPLCKQSVKSILYSVQADNSFKEHVIPSPAAPSVVEMADGAHGHLAAHGFHQPEAIQTPATEPLPTSPVGDFYCYAWASIFRTYPAVLYPLLPWLHEELRLLLDDEQEAAEVQSLVMSSLHYLGLDEEAMIQLLQASLGRHTRVFVQQLIDNTTRECRREAQRWLQLENARAARRQEGHVEASFPGRSPAPSPALHGGPNSSLSSPVPTYREQREPQEYPEEAMPGPSTLSWGSQHSPEVP